MAETRTKSTFHAWGMNHLQWNLRDDGCWNLLNVMPLYHGFLHNLTLRMLEISMNQRNHQQLGKFGSQASRECTISSVYALSFTPIVRILARLSHEPKKTAPILALQNRNEIGFPLFHLGVPFPLIVPSPLPAATAASGATLKVHLTSISKPRAIL